jgi:hypothetical protein
MQPGYRLAAFYFNNRDLVLRGSVPDPPPPGVRLNVSIAGPESRDYRTIAGATVPFRFDRERDRVPEYLEAKPGEPEPAEWVDVYTQVPMSVEMARRLHVGKLASAEVVAEILGVSRELAD